LLVPFVLYFMPGAWDARMATIENYQADGSAMGRINAWQMAFNLALDRPFFGGGFETFQPEAFLQWAPNPHAVHDAHSIWFEVLGEHGFVGLMLYLLMWFFSWRTASMIIRLSKGQAGLKWANDLAKLIQVALVGFWVGGSFLGLAYWDYPYILLIVLVLTQRLVRMELPSLAASAQRPGRLSEGVRVEITSQR
jgi:probable O-glycosylation ligase (exosortase A-associated)